MVPLLLVAWPVAFVFAQETQRDYPIRDLVHRLDDFEPMVKKIENFVTKISPDTKVDAYFPSFSISVRADEKTQELVAELLVLIRSTHRKEEKNVSLTKESMSTINIIRLTNSLAEDISRTILHLLPENPLGESIRIAPDRTSNSLVIVTANPEDAQVIEALVMQLDKPASEIRNPNKDFDELIGQSLQKKAELAVQWYNIVKTRFEVGGQGGTAQEEARARLFMLRVQGDLLLWEYKRAENPETKAELMNRVQEIFAAEISAAEDWARAAQLANQAGPGDIKDVITALSELEDVKIRQFKAATYLIGTD